jgi:hypothetical protein
MRGQHLRWRTPCRRTEVEVVSKGTPLADVIDIDGCGEDREALLVVQQGVKGILINPGHI